MRTTILLLSCLIIRLTISAQSPCINGMAGDFPCENIDHVNSAINSNLDSFFNDIWGWVHEESGREFVILGSNASTTFFEITNPEEIIEIGFLESQTFLSTWRDIKVYQDHAYIVSDNNANHGLQIFNLNRLIDEFTGTLINFESDAHYDGVTSAHNIAINEQTGYAYIVGDETFNGGLHMLDISDPLNPIIAGGYLSSGYIHDTQVVIYEGLDEDYLGKEIAFCCTGNSVDIVDVTDKDDPVLISSIGYANSIDTYTHQGWLTENHRSFIFNDEFDEDLGFTDVTRTFFLDLEDLDNPQLDYVFNSNTGAIDHNLYVNGSLCYQSHNSAGLRVLDVGNVEEHQISEVAFFDCFPEHNDPTFSGTWSNYSYFPSGVVAISHRDFGLFLLQPKIINAQRFIEVCYSPESVTYSFDCTWNAMITDVLVSNLPDGASYEVSELQMPGRTEITVSFSETLNPGQYSFPLTVLSNGQELYSTALRLVFYENTEIINLEPETGDFDQGEPVQLSWDGIIGIDTYQLLISEDSEFTSIVIDEYVYGNFYEFNGVGTHYWKVKLNSVCGPDIESETSVFSSIPFGVEEKDLRINIYPNPARDYLKIEGVNGQANIWSLDGKLVQSQNINSTGDINISNLESGIYTLITENGNGVFQFIKE